MSTDIGRNCRGDNLNPECICTSCAISKFCSRLWLSRSKLSTRDRMAFFIWVTDVFTFLHPVTYLTFSVAQIASCLTVMSCTEARRRLRNVSMTNPRFYRAWTIMTRRDQFPAKPSHLKENVWTHDETESNFTNSCDT